MKPRMVATNAPWEEVDGEWRKQTNAAHKELSKRNSTVRIEGGFTYVKDRDHGRLLDRGLYLPRE